ncbi:MAG: FAD-binding oxidoreductase [Pseudomonadota bacterium]
MSNLATDNHDLVVVGGGVLGSTVALFAARGGMNVGLIDRGPICREASGTNAGTLTMQMTRVALIPYALEGHRMWANAQSWLGHDVGVQVCDGLSLAFTENEEEILVERANLRREAGAPIELITAHRAKQIEPGLGDGIRVAAHCTVDGYAAAYLTGRAYRNALEQAGVTLYEGCPVKGIEQGQNSFTIVSAMRRVRARRLVLAGGVWLETMLGWLGVKVPVKVLVNQLAVTTPIKPVMRTVLGIASGLLSLKQFPHGSVVIGGGWQARGDKDRDRGTVLPDQVVGNTRLAIHTIPQLRDAKLLRAWTGYEAETEDAMPMVGPVPNVDGAYVCGSIHSGYTSGPYIAKLLADHLLGREPERPLFPIDRLLLARTPPQRIAEGVA